MFRHALGFLALQGCVGEQSPNDHATADRDVIAMVAQRDGVAEEAAARYVDEVELLADAARAEHAALEDPPPLVSDARTRHLRRAALARVWMRDVFEPKHTVAAIAEDDPVVQKALASPLYVRPELVRLCQVIAVPSGFDDDREGLMRRAKEPDWASLAYERLRPIARRLQTYVHPDDPDACGLLRKLMRFEDKDDGVVALRVESKAFHLDACVRKRDDGTCDEPQWAPEWVENVRPQTTGGFVPLFESRFGVHMVFVVEVLDAVSAEDPSTLETVREAILDPWRADRYDQRMDALRKKWSVKVITGRGEQP